VKLQRPPQIRQVSSRCHREEMNHRKPPQVSAPGQSTQRNVGIASHHQLLLNDEAKENHEGVYDTFLPIWCK